MLAELPSMSAHGLAVNARPLRLRRAATWCAVALLAGSPLTTCETTPTFEPTAGLEGGAEALGLLVLRPDLADAQAQAARLTLRVDGVVAASVATGPGAPTLEGSVVVPVAAGEHRVRLEVATLAGVRQVEAVVDVSAGTVVVVGSDPGAAMLQVEPALRLGDDTIASIDRSAAGATQAVSPPLGPAAVPKIVALLADPGVAVVTPLAPLAAEEVDPALDALGPLVAAATPQAPGGIAAASAADSAYYSYCSCGRPVPDRDLTLRTKGGDALALRTDRHGLTLLRGDVIDSIDYGQGQRPRPRGYDYTIGDGGSRDAARAALRSGVPGEMLTAIMDFANDPGAGAEAELLAHLDHPDPVVYHAAALALGKLAAVDAAVAQAVEREIGLRAALLGEGYDVLRQIFVLGAMRRPSALPALVEATQSGAVEVRAEATWALGFLATDAALPALSSLAADPDVAVRVDAAIALARSRQPGAKQALERLASDPDGGVAALAAAGLGWLRAGP